MFAGHLGVAMAIGHVEKRVNVGAYAFAALGLDVALWLFILAGWETVFIPADFVATHQPLFEFPYSHGLMAACGWSVLAAGVTVYATRSVRAGTWIAAAVLSHWGLDFLVHAPELPLWGPDSARAGLGLWNAMPVALAVEALLALGGLYLYLSDAVLSRAKRIAVGVLSFAVLGFTALGMTLAPAPPSAMAMAASSLVTILAVCATLGWLARKASGVPIPAHGGSKR